jgi:hypothetical protein
LVVATTGSTVNVTAGATVSSANVDNGAITITSGGTPGASYSSSNITINGTVNGGGQAGITVTNAPYIFPNSYGTTQASITVGQGGVVQGSRGIVVAADPSTPLYASNSVSLTNSGTISGSAGLALYAPNAATGYFSNINNQASGQIGAIVGQVGTLTNAGVIDGGGVSALTVLSSAGYGGPSHNFARLDRLRRQRREYRPDC